MSTKFEQAKTYYDALIAKHPDVERKGAKSAYTSMNGNMFSFLTADGGLALRLDAETRERFMAKHGLKLSVQDGTVMKEYVQIPPKLLANGRVMARVFDESVTQARSLRAKPTTRKKATKKTSKKSVVKKAAKKAATRTKAR